MSTPAVLGLAFLANGVGMLVAFVAVFVDADRDAIGEARQAAAVAAARALVAVPARIDGRAYVARASRWPLRVTPDVLDAARHDASPWRAPLVPGMSWLTNGQRHTRLAEPAPEIIARVRAERRREEILREATGEFRALVHRALYDLAAAFDAATIEPAYEEIDGTFEVVSEVAA